MALPGRLPSEVDVVVIGAGFAGASAAEALALAGVTSGVVLERELLPGSHAFGRNAAMARQLEEDPVLLKLAVEGVRRLRAKNVDGRPVLRQTGGLYLIHGKSDRAAEWRALLHHYCVPSELWPAAKARQRFLFLREFEFDYALFCPTDGIVDIHALLSDLLAEARAAGFEVITDCACESLMFDGSVVCHRRVGGVSRSRIRCTPAETPSSTPVRLRRLGTPSARRSAGVGPGCRILRETRRCGSPSLSLR
jgi:D-arginine dehydrogenase